MAGRDFQIFGEFLVAVNFGFSVPNTVNIAPGGQDLVNNVGANLSNLGLTAGPVQVHINTHHQDVHTDAWGHKIPVDSQYQLTDAIIQTRMIHWDPDIMELCLREAMAGGGDPTSATQPAGTLGPAGYMMGGGTAPATPNTPFFPGSGYHFISLNLLPSRGNLPWRFPACALTGPPTVFPLGTQASIVDCSWRAIPYGIKSSVATSISGSIEIFAVEATGTPFLFDHTPDAPFLVQGT